MPSAKLLAWITGISLLVNVAMDRYRASQSG